MCCCEPEYSVELGKPKFGRDFCGPFNLVDADLGSEIHERKKVAANDYGIDWRVDGVDPATGDDEKVARR